MMFNDRDSSDSRPVLSLAVGFGCLVCESLRKSWRECLDLWCKALHSRARVQTGWGWTCWKGNSHLTSWVLVHCEDVCVVFFRVNLVAFIVSPFVMLDVSTMCRHVWIFLSTSKWRTQGDTSPICTIIMSSFLLIAFPLESLRSLGQDRFFLSRIAWTLGSGRLRNLFFYNCCFFLFCQASENFPFSPCLCA